MGKVLRSDGTVRVRIIGPGKGSSAVYEAEQLKRDGGVFKGAQVFWDHPSTKEERERPERSLRDLCGVAVSDPVYDEAGPKGAGLYTDVRVFKPYQPLVEEMGPHIGVSIRAAGSVVTKQVNGESVRVAEKFTSGGFDFVTKAGAGGTVVPLYESARKEAQNLVDAFHKTNPTFIESEGKSETDRFIEWATGNASPEEDNSMELKEAVAALEASKSEVATLKEENKALSIAAMLREAREVIASELMKETTLLEVSRERITASVMKEAPFKEGKLDKEALAGFVKEAAKVEKAYIEALKPRGITGMGQAGTTDGKARLRESLIAMHLQNGEGKEKAERLADLAIAGR